MNWQTDVIAAGHGGKTDAEIAAALVATPLTVSPIAIDYLRAYLRDREHNGQRLLRWDGTVWDGVLHEVSQNEAMPQLLRDGIRDLKAKLTSPESATAPMLTNERTDAKAAYVKVAQLTGALVQIGAITSEHVAEVYALGGGLRYAAVTTETVADARASHIRDTTLDAAFAAADEARRNGGTVAEVAAAFAGEVV